VLVEQYLGFARELRDHFAMMDRGQIVYSASDAGVDEGGLKRVLAI
jgi:urea transport system ATP-binding protein